MFFHKIKEDTYEKIKSMMQHIRIYLNLDQDKVFKYIENPKGANFPWFYQTVLKTKKEFIKLFMSDSI